jgi:hypothetical protein
VFSIFPTMHRMYKSWKDIFGWGKPVSFTNLPKHYNPTLINGAGLKRDGRSTAVDFWAKREHGNFIKLWRQTGALEEFAEMAYTYFYVVQTSKVNEIMPMSLSCSGRGVPPPNRTVAATAAAGDIPSPAKKVLLLLLRQGGSPHHQCLAAAAG